MLGERMGVAMPRVAVRSSATTEDLEKASGAGQNLTLLDISGNTNLIAAVLQCWSSLFSQNALAYRRRRGLHRTGEIPVMAVGIQALVTARVSGVIFTADPVSGDSSRVVIEAIGGLGEPLVAGELTPDRLVVDKRTGRVIEQRISNKGFELACTATSSFRRKIPAERRHLPCLTHDDRERLLALAHAVEAALGSDMDIEWAIDQGGHCFLLQARPITVGRVAPSMPEGSLDAARPRSALLDEMYRRWSGN
jgi:phosphoenolpyruvate synthase/pyruvate phosphate dikinase